MLCLPVRLQAPAGQEYVFTHLYIFIFTLFSIWCLDESVKKILNKYLIVSLVTHNMTKAAILEMLRKSQMALACHLTICSVLSDSFLNLCLVT